MHVCVCVAKPFAVELRCHATALIAYAKAGFLMMRLICNIQCTLIFMANFKLVVIFFIFCSKHRLWVFVETTSLNPSFTV